MISTTFSSLLTMSSSMSGVLPNIELVVVVVREEEIKPERFKPDASGIT